MSHTPGPWEWSEETEDLHPVSALQEARRLGTYPEGSIIVTDSGYYPPYGADRALIAAAPDLLEALIEADQLFSTYRLTATGGMEVGRWICKARDAIAKATKR